MKSQDCKWICISNCGSCCRLAPEERAEAIGLLSEDQQKEYFSLVGQDGWCKNYDKSNKKCLIYERRPEFCKVDNLTSIIGCGKDDMDSLAIEYCIQNIRSIYGGRSKVLKEYKKKIRNT